MRFSIEDITALLSTYAPDWALDSVRPVSSTGTDNALFMLGDDHVLRIPGRKPAVKLLRKELLYLPRLAGLLLAVPKVLFHGQTQNELGFDFGVLEWLKGSVATPDQIDDPAQAACDLANFLAALRNVPTDGAPVAGPENGNRGAELAGLTNKTLASIEVLADEIHANAARDLWRQACSTPFKGPLVWVHGDLKADNMLARNGHLTSAIDWGLAAAGDPAVDLAAAWTWIEPDARKVFQTACDQDDATWNRAQGWALYSAVIALSYYRNRSHETLCAQSRRTLQMLGLRRT